VSNLRAALAKNRAELERSYPRHARQVSALLPAVLRGLYAEHTFGSHLDIDDALAGAPRGDHPLHDYRAGSVKARALRTERLGAERKLALR
jgi:hypothetical protein